MTTELTENPKRENAIEALASRLQVSKDVLQTTLKATAFKDCKTNEEFVACVIVANTYRLNPLLKEIYAFSGKGGGIVPIVPVDGWIKIATSHEQYDGVEQVFNDDANGKLKSVTTKFYRKGVSHPTVVTEYLEECMRDTEPWKKWPRRMLGHKGYIQGARKAFGFSGIYDEDEAQRIIEVQATETPAPKEIEMPRAKAPEPGQVLHVSGPNPSAQEFAEAVERDTAAPIASPTQIKNLYLLAGQAGLVNGKLFEFLAERSKNPDKITVSELQTCLQDIAAIIDGKSKKK